MRLATEPNLDRLDYFVINLGTGNTIAGFLLLQHAIDYAKQRAKREGPSYPIYAVVDHLGNSVFLPINSEKDDNKND